MSTITTPNPATTDLVTILNSAGHTDVGTLTLGSNTFIGREPDAPDATVTLFDTPGRPPRRLYDPTIADQRPSVQVRVRDRSYLAAYTLITAICAALHNKAFTVDSTEYTAIYVSQPPALLDWDANGRCRWVATFDIQRQPAAGTHWQVVT